MSFMVLTSHLAMAQSNLEKEHGRENHNNPVHQETHQATVTQNVTPPQHQQVPAQVVPQVTQPQHFNQQSPSIPNQERRQTFQGNQDYGNHNYNNNYEYERREQERRYPEVVIVQPNQQYITGPTVEYNQQLVEGFLTVVAGDVIVINGQAIHLRSVKSPSANAICQNNGQWRCGQAAKDALDYAISGQVARCNILQYGVIPEASCQTSSGDLSMLAVQVGSALPNGSGFGGVLEQAQANGAGLWMSGTFPVW